MSGCEGVLVLRVHLWLRFFFSVWACFENPVHIFKPMLPKLWSMNSCICLLSHRQVANSHKFLEKLKELCMAIVSKRRIGFLTPSSFALWLFQFLSMDPTTFSEFHEKIDLENQQCVNFSFMFYWVLRTRSISILNTHFLMTLFLFHRNSSNFLLMHMHIWIYAGFLDKGGCFQATMNMKRPLSDSKQLILNWFVFWMELWCTKLPIQIKVKSSSAQEHKMCSLLRAPYFLMKAFSHSFSTLRSPFAY